MSALSFKINAETDKLKSFITMLERLRQVLAEIPDSTKEFDVINRKIGEMEARVEQTMRKIAQMEQQAMDAASKATCLGHDWNCWRQLYARNSGYPGRNCGIS